tara:strand:- start:24263 stop:24919 length:657 start_codon:yes stop_codon:yes gene_type:complete
MDLNDFELDDITPASKKKRKADGGQKGKRGERELCKIFTNRFGKEFTRTIGSGNRWSQVAHMPSHAKNTFTGDICAPEGFLFSLECKNGYEDKVDLGNLFSTKNKTLDGFLKQSIKEAKECDKLPLLCWKRKRQPWIAFIREQDVREGDEWDVQLTYHDWLCVSLDGLLELPDSFFFAESMAVSNMGTCGNYKVVPCCDVEVVGDEKKKNLDPPKKDS